MKTYTLFSFFLFAVNLQATAKNNLIRGTVLTENMQPIRDVVISKNWSKTGFVSMQDGSFQIQANSNDTLIFKHLAFEPKAIALNNIPKTKPLEVILTPRTVELGEVQVTNWGTWNDFKHKILNKSIDSINNTPENRLNEMFPHAKTHPIKNPYFRAFDKIEITPTNILLSMLSGQLFRMVYTNLSKEQKYRREITSDILREQKIKRNDHRYSSKTLSNLLNIKEQELEKFKIYCDTRVDLSLNDYELIKQINELYKDWKTQKTKYQQIRKTKENYLKKKF